MLIGSDATNPPWESRHASKFAADSFNRDVNASRDAIRRFEKHHLILGDRYEANAPIEREIVNAAKHYVDVLCFQDFNEPVKHLDEWHKKTGIPVLLADAAKIDRSASSQCFATNGQWYADILTALDENNGCICFHRCVAYQRNKARRRGRLDERENPDKEQVSLIESANQQVLQLMSEWISITVPVFESGYE